MTFYKICGKVDGFCKKDNIEYIFEIKNRKNKIFTDIPIYEKIQLLIYTKLLNNNNIIFVQNIDNNIKRRENTIISLSNEIINKWGSISELSDYIKKSRSVTSALVQRHEQMYINDILIYSSDVDYDLSYLKSKLNTSNCKVFGYIILDNDSNDIIRFYL